MKIQPIIFYIAEAGIYPFARNPSIFSRALNSIGQPTFFIHCTGQITRCAAMAMRNLPGKIDDNVRQNICNECQKNIAMLQERYQLNLLKLANFYTEEDRKVTQEFVAAAMASPYSTTYEDIPVGVLAYRSVALESKDASKDFTGSRLELMQSYLGTAIDSYIITKRIIKEIRPSAFFFGQQYCFESVSELACKKYGVFPSYHTTTTLNGYDYGRILFYSQQYILQLQQHIKEWDKFSNRPLSPQAVESCWDDVFFRNYKSNSHVYSPAKENNLVSLVSAFSLKQDYKTIVAYVSSPDERSSMELTCQAYNFSLNVKDVFDNQVTWLKKLVAFVAERKNIQLIIRMHPRLGMDHRSNVASPHLDEFKTALADLPPRCHVVWPQDPISSYDLAELADVVLVSWSTMGREVSRIGIPVIAAASNFYYPNDDFIKSPTSEEEYFHALSTALEEEYTLAMLQKAIRFNWYTAELPALDLRDYLSSDLVPIEHDSLPVILPQETSLLIKDILLGKTDATAYNLRKIYESPNSEEEEIKTIHREICFFIHNLFYPPQKNTKKRSTTVLKGIKKTVKALCPVGIWPYLQKILSAIKCKPNAHVAAPPIGRKVIFQRPPYKFIVKHTIEDLGDYTEQTQKDDNLCVIVSDSGKVFYIKNGVVLQRTSPLLNRLLALC